MSTDRTAEILNYLSAISREVGAFRAETQTRFDRLEAEVRETHKEVRTLNTRFDRLESRVLNVRARQRDLEERVGVLDGKPPTDF